jgi:hypothetical protein
MVWFLLTILIILQIADIYTTKRIIADKGGKELNPIMKDIINKFGLLPGLIGIKTIVMIFIATVFFAAPNTIIIPILLFAIILIYVYVVYKNFKVLKEIKSK